MLMKNTLSAQFLYQRLAEIFKPENCTDIFAKKGLQEHNSDTVKKVYTATFASPSVFENVFARNERNVMIYTHHPLPAMPSLQEGYGTIPEKYFEEMKKREINFFSYHIPMDVSGPYSTGTTLAKAMGCNTYDSWYPQNGANLGALNQTGCKTVHELLELLQQTIGHRAALYQYGDENLIDGHFAIMAGIARSVEAYTWLREHNINTLIIGVTNPVVEFTQKIQAAAKENHINLIGGTHYSTEKFALMNLCQYFNNLGVDAEFIPETPVMTEIYLFL